MIRQRIEQKLKAAIEKAGPDLNNLHMEPAVLESLSVERPRNPQHGDYAVNVSPLARFAKMPPPKIAESVQQKLAGEGVDASVIAGFINFRVNDAVMAQALIDILESKAPGKNESMSNDSILLEYVSANPTGPLHIGHGRWAALGDSLVRIWRHCGATVTPEFYINDAGVQMHNIALSIWLRGAEILDLLVPDEMQPPPYPGEYVRDLAIKLLNDESAKAKIREQQATAPLKPDVMWIIPFAREEVLGQQKALLERIGVHFEAWFSELDLLELRKHDSKNHVESILDKLRRERFAYESDGALWLQSSELGDEKDRVLIKSDGEKTYLAGDIAYHDHKFNRKDDDGHPQYNRIINIWGADHHGYIARMRAALVALGHLKDEKDPRFEILLGQLVNLIVDGEKERMGKRRKMVTLEDVVDEVGVDAVRFWMVSKSADTALDFDVDLAKSASQDNPVYYAQYAHARCASILRNAVAPSPNVDTGEIQQPFISREALEALEKLPTTEDLYPLFHGLGDDNARELLKDLIFKLDGFEDLLADAARIRAPHLVARYTLDLAAQFHSFYNVCRVLTPDPVLTKSRLALIIALRKTFAQALSLLGVSAPESM